MSIPKITKFAKESDLCAAFIAALPDDWTPYPETGGFDILLVRKEDGFQIGVEAKLRLNARVICQAAEDGCHYRTMMPGPDCRAILIPASAANDLAVVCRLLGITIIRMAEDDRDRRSYGFRPDLPKLTYRYSTTPDDDWFERCPVSRLPLPDYVPDVLAGASAPMALTLWKIAAIKIAVTLEKRGYVTRQDFKHFGVNMSRWIDPYARWLVQDGKGGWIRGPYLPDFRVQHPVNYVQIEGDFDTWKNPAVSMSQPILSAIQQAADVPA